MWCIIIILTCALQAARTEDGFEPGRKPPFFAYHNMPWAFKYSAARIMNLTITVIESTNSKFNYLEQYIKSARARSVPYEVGYLYAEIHTVYRKMLDKYITAKDIWKKLYTIEHIIYLEEIEHGYWAILHQMNMLHEVERKYGVEDDIHYSPTHWSPTTRSKSRTHKRRPGRINIDDLYDIIKYSKDLSYLTKMTSRGKFGQWPLEYGWDVKRLPGPTVVALDQQQATMLRGMPWSLRAKALDFFDGENTRRSALSHPMVAEMTRRSNAEDIMTVKLFKLMYETVKECDAKVGKAEKLRKIYNKSKPFEVGYMFGDITDKYSTMQDIAKTLRRMYNQWQPIEHVNAYEQIASQGIELNHLVDILKSTYNLN